LLPTPSQIAPLSWETAKAVLPLTGLFLLNVLSGLGGTQRISLPMFTVLRRFTILMTMLLEKYLGMSKPSRAVYISVGMMLGGAGVAALSDVSFDAKGYAMILANDFLTAFYGITMKRAMTGKSVTKSSLMFYNALFSSIAMVSLSACAVLLMHTFSYSPLCH
jgi:solute carrier family 35